jgi:hypothetical protein
MAVSALSKSPTEIICLKLLTLPPEKKITIIKKPREQGLEM